MKKFHVLLAALLAAAAVAPAAAQPNGTAPLPAVQASQLPAATPSTLGAVRIGSTLTVNAGLLSLTAGNIAAALGFAPVAPSDLSPYLTTASASATYLPSATAATTYAPLASPAFTTGATIDGAAIATQTYVAGLGYLTSAALAPYLASATAAATYAPLASPALTGHPTGVTELSSDNSTRLATTAYVTTAAAAAAQGLNVKAPVRLVATSNVTVAAPGATLDGVSPSNGDRIGLVAQSTASQNGIYVFNGSASPLTRASDAAGTSDFSGQPYFLATAGTAGGGTSYVMTPATITVGTTAQVWSKFAQVTQYSAGTGLLLSGTQFSSDTSVMATKASLATVATTGLWSDLAGSAPQASGSGLGLAQCSSTVTCTAGVLSLTGTNLNTAAGATVLTTASTLSAGKLSGTLPAVDASVATVLATGSTTARSLASRFTDVIYAADWGVTGDGVYFPAAVITNSAGSPTALTVAGASFVSGNVGKKITVDKIGAAGVALTTTIATVVDGTHITLGTSASTFVTATPAIVAYGTDNGLLINNAIAAVFVRSPQGGQLVLPPGMLLVDRNALFINVQSNLVLRGQGRGATIILDDDLLRCGGGVIQNGSNSATAITNFHMRDLTVRGMADGNYTQCGHLVGIGNSAIGALVSDVSIENCAFLYSRFMGVAMGGGTGVTFRNNHIYWTVRDGVHIDDMNDLLIEGNWIQQTNDDSIAAHTNDIFASPTRSGIVIANNLITDSQGMHILGGKNVTITGNVMRRIMSYAFSVGGAPGYTQGNTPVEGVRITNNVIADVFERNGSVPLQLNAEKYYIDFGTDPKSPGGGSSPPGIPATGSGTVTPLYGATVGNFYTNNITAGIPPLTPPQSIWTGTSTVPTMGAYMNEISGNTLIRTLPAVTSYADWGYAASINQGIAGPYTGSVTESNLNVPGIRFGTALRATRISNNLIQTSGTYGVFAKVTQPWLDMDLDGLMIDSNRMIDVSIACFLPPAINARVVLRDNECDADPYFKSANRGSNGTWASGAAGPYGFDLRTMSGALVERNTFRNLSVPVSLSTPINNLKDNWIVGEPAAVGFSVSNKGVGNMPAAGGGFDYLIEHSDPTLAAYGQIVSQTVADSATIPTTGSYVAGHFVRNSAPSISGGKVLLGWVRLTTGSANVAGTDWQALYASTS